MIGDTGYRVGPSLNLGWGLAILSITSLLASSALAQDRGRPTGPWRMSIEGGAAHLFDADGDDGGSVAVTRTFVEPAIAYGLDRQTSIGLAASFGLDDYDFDGSDGLVGLSPWNKIAEYSLSLPIRFGVNPGTTAIIVPSIRWNAETGADLDDAMSAGGFAGLAYRISDSLSLGPGLVVSSGIEEKTTLLPILLVDWDVSERVSLSTGGGGGISRGPALTLSWKTSDELRLSLGASYESRRFRLDGDGPAADGVGEDRAVSVTASATYSPLPFIQARILGGLSFSRELELEDEDGDRIIDEKVDPAPFVGFSLRARW